MEHLFSAWGEVAPRLQAAGHFLLLSDYDGTLTPIVERPEHASLPPRTRQLLERLARHHRFTVGIISGRALNDLRRRVNLGGIVYAGNHGLEIEGPGLSFIHPIAEELRPLFRLLHQVLRRTLGAVRGVLVEDKGLTLSVHYRLVEEERADQVKGVLEGVVAPARSWGKVKTTSGKKVYEVRPDIAWNKGKAISLLLNRYGKRKGEVLPIFLGDDLTDEDGFVEIEKHRGISIFVGEEDRPTAAHFFLKSPQEVEKFLGMLLDLIGGGQP